MNTIREYKLPEGTPFLATSELHFEPMEESIHIEDVSFTICTAGAAIVEIDMQTHELHPQTEMILMPGSLLRVISVSPDFRCTELICSQRFIFNMGMRPDPDFIKFLRFNPAADIDPEGFETLSTHFYALAIDLCKHADSKHAVEKMRHLVQFYMLSISELTFDKWRDANSVQTNRQTDLFRQFISLVHDNAQTRHEVEWYADQLAVTQRYLCQICQNKNATPKAVIDEHIIHMAKEMLHSTDMTVQEITASLNFADQSVFARFFKRKTGVSPIEWRKKVR